MAIDINWLAILVSVIIMQALGFLWYGPLFGKPYLKMLGVDAATVTKEERNKSFKRSVIPQIICSFLIAFTLKHNVVFGSAYLMMGGVAAGLQAGFWNWLGFVATVSLGSVLWEKKPWKFWFITAGYYLVAMLIVGIVLATWI